MMIMYVLLNWSGTLGVHVWIRVVQDQMHVIEGEGKNAFWADVLFMLSFQVIAMFDATLTLFCPLVGSVLTT
jgi:hypothetical protein